MGTALFSMFLMLTLYMQQVLDFSPLKTGVGYLAVAGTAIIWANVAAQLVTRVGVKPTLVVRHVADDGRPALLHPGLGRRLLLEGPLPGLPRHRVRHAVRVRPAHDRGACRDEPHEAGLASGLINTSQQIGGAVGIAILSTVATSTTTDSVKSGTAVPEALTNGFQNAFWVGAAITLAGVIVSLVLVRQRDFEPAPGGGGLARSCLGSAALLRLRRGGEGERGRVRRSTMRRRFCAGTPASSPRSTDHESPGPLSRCDLLRGRA